MNPEASTNAYDNDSEELGIHVFLQIAADNLYTENTEYDPYNVSRYVAPRVAKQVARMEREGLAQAIRTDGPSHGGTVIKYTRLGLQIANSPGGYIAYLQENIRKQTQLENERVERDNRERSTAAAAITSAEASVRSADASERATSISNSALKTSWIIGSLTILISIAALIYQIIANNTLAEELASSKRETKVLSQRIKTLEKSAMQSDNNR